MGKGLGTLGEHRRTKGAWGCVGRKVASTVGFLAQEVRLLWKQGHRGQGKVLGGSSGSCHNMTHLVRGGRNGRAEKWGIPCHNRNHTGNLSCTDCPCSKWTLGVRRTPLSQTQENLLQVFSMAHCPVRLATSLSQGENKTVAGKGEKKHGTLRAARW